MIKREARIRMAKGSDEIVRFMTVSLMGRVVDSNGIDGYPTAKINE
jgi:hypothetical protein